MTPPKLERCGKIWIVRDDLIPGGTKVRALPALLSGASEFVYASPVYGFAQIALAHAAEATGKKATIFCAERRTWHPRTAAAAEAGAVIVPVPCGYMSVVRARARAYCALTGARLLPFGFDAPEFLDALAAAISTVSAPRQAWAVAGSGVLVRAMQRAWPETRVHAVQIGSAPKVGSAKLHVAPERFEQDARRRPPFPSCSNYDAKAWQFLQREAEPGAVFWNVAR